MNGAQIIVQTLSEAGVNLCLVNPGTTEAHLTESIGNHPGMKSVLVLFEGIATGAADGYARMTGKPACTLLHLGPGLANSLSNLHNARRAGSPVINIIGDHPQYLQKYDSFLSSDIKAIASPLSDWVSVTTSAQTVHSDTIGAISASMKYPRGIATLIVPASVAWQQSFLSDTKVSFQSPSPVDESVIKGIAHIVRSGRKSAFLLRGNAVNEEGLEAAGSIAMATGSRIFIETTCPRIQRGAGTVEVERLPYRYNDLYRFLADIEHLILVESNIPGPPFSYSDSLPAVIPAHCAIHVLAQPHEDGLLAMKQLASGFGAAGKMPLTVYEKTAIPAGATLHAVSIMQMVAKYLPEDSIICDESFSGGFSNYHITTHAARHDYLRLSGGALGNMMAGSIGAALACPGRKIICLIGDGSVPFSVQALWTQARERLNIITIVFSDNAYSIVKDEMNLQCNGPFNEKVRALLELTNPVINWSKIAQGFGVQGGRATTCNEFETLLLAALKEDGPWLIEAII
ncbi:MAG TPA: acetolactate synthase large subunit [Chitinophaga sp.]|uniref:acetolactate synthase large subunit n=1 Tax=Chitinophaga sp. TaxID=1869181 RepID=UPI002BB45385|nr:acetolactate synthase large subunit [Chitinophaga sp.]HVI48444.1 acetolactate synthase large subunit [Chitinophaga sp.]